MFEANVFQCADFRKSGLLMDFNDPDYCCRRRWQSVADSPVLQPSRSHDAVKPFLHPDAEPLEQYKSNPQGYSGRHNARDSG